MPTDDKNRRKEFLSGAAVSIGLIGICMFLVMDFSDWVDNLPLEQHGCTQTTNH